MNYMALATVLIAGSLSAIQLVGLVVLTLSGTDVPPELTENLRETIVAAIVTGPMAASLLSKREGD